jgi:hypothetical protein
MEVIPLEQDRAHITADPADDVPGQMIMKFDAKD